MGEASGAGDLGTRGFRRTGEDRIGGAGSKREQPSVRRFESRDLESVLKSVAGYFNLPEEKLVGRRTGHRDERPIAMELMHRYGGASQPEIGRMMGDLDYTAVSPGAQAVTRESQNRKRVEGGIGRDRNLVNVIG